MRVKVTFFVDVDPQDWSVFQEPDLGDVSLAVAQYIRRGLALPASTFPGEPELIRVLSIHGEPVPERDPDSVRGYAR